MPSHSCSLTALARAPTQVTGQHLSPDQQNHVFHMYFLGLQYRLALHAQHCEVVSVPAISVQDARHFIIANDGRVSRHRTWEESGGRTTLQLMRSTASRSDPCIRPLTCGGRDSVEAMWVSITTNVPPRRVPQHVAAPSPATARTLNHVRSLPCACSYGLSPTR